MIKYTFIVLMSFFTLIGLTGCSEKKAPPGLPPILVQVAKATSRDVPQLLSVFGTIAAVNSVDIIPQVSGTLMQSYVEYGALVKEGDDLFTIDQRSYMANLAKAFADVKAKQGIAQVAQDKARRSQPLVAQNLISPQDFETLLAQADRAVQDVIMAEATLALADINLGYTAIQSPLTGVAGVQTYSNGDYMEAGKTKILTINQVDPIQVNIFIPGTAFAKVQRAFNDQSGKLPMMVQLLDEPSMAPIKGQTSFFDNNISPQTGTIQLQGILPNADHKLWVGQFVNVDLQLGMLKNAVLAPRACVTIGPKGPYVFVVNNEGAAELRLVKTGEVFEDDIVLLSGVQAGETVVTLGQMKLKAGSQVKIIKSDSAGEASSNLASDASKKTKAQSAT